MDFIIFQYIKNTLNPAWKKFTIPVRTLCNGDYDRNIKVICYDRESDGDHKLIGEFYVTLRQLIQGPGPSNVFQCIHPEKKVGGYLFMKYWRLVCKKTQIFLGCI